VVSIFSQMPFWTKKQSIQEFAKGSQSRKGLVLNDIHNFPNVDIVKYFEDLK
jgi:hypothetical protein